MAVWSVCVGGCHVHAVSPPVSPLDLESAATSGEGRLGLAGSYSHHEGPSADTGDVRSLTGRLSYGATEWLDVRVGMMRHAFGDAPVPLTRSVRRDVLGGWAGAKFGMIPRRRRAQPMLALEASIGGGEWELGGFVGADSGVVFSFENPYVVPFIGGGLGVSVPVNASAIPLDWSRLDTNDSVGRLVPDTTYTFQTTGGVKLLLPGAEQDALGRTDGSVALLIGFRLLYLRDDQESYSFLSASIGIEATLPSLTRAHTPPPTTSW